MVKASIAGGSGYVGGELLRLLLAHPQVEVVQVSARSSAGSHVHFVHPHLRGQTRLQFCSAEEIAPCDLLFLALPHGEAMAAIERWADLAERIVDLSADFRLRDPDAFARWYGKPHPARAWLERFVYGLPELERAALAGARYASGVGCNATAVNLALLPLLGTGLVDWERGIIAEVKVGSSEAGNQPSEASHHPIRAGVVRSFAPTGHRHTAEVEQALAAAGTPARVHLSATAIEMVRGVLATVHVFVREGTSDKELFSVYRQRLHEEPFVRLVKEQRGLYRYPEPKILTGSNHAEIAFELDRLTQRAVLLAAIDNLMKGAAGSAVQAMNLMYGWPETQGLEFPGLHPV